MVYNSRTKNSRDDWETPQYFFNLLDKEFHFTLDPCASHINHKCDKYYTIEDDGLKQSWKNERVFINPPYKQKELWIDKVIKEKINAVILIPSATDTKLFEKIWLRSAEIRFVVGRINFMINNKTINGNNRGSILCIFDGYNHLIPKTNLFYHKE